MLFATAASLLFALGTAKAAAIAGPVLPNVPQGPVYTDPASGGRRIHPYGRDDLCVSVIGAYMADQGALSGEAVQIAYCYDNDNVNRFAQLWDVQVGTTGTNVRLHAFPNLCLDAGSSPYSGGDMKVYTCGDQWPQQMWNQLTVDGMFQTANGQCLDVQLGSQPGTQIPFPSQGTLQTWQCFYDGNVNQAFHLLN